MAAQMLLAPLSDGGLALPGGLVGQCDVGNMQPGLLTDGEEFGSRVEWVSRPLRPLVYRSGLISALQDETTTDGEVLPPEHCSTPLIVGGETHAIAVRGKELVTPHGEIAAGNELDAPATPQSHPAFGPNPLQDRTRSHRGRSGPGGVPPDPAGSPCRCRGRVRSEPETRTARRIADAPCRSLPPRLPRIEPQLASVPWYGSSRVRCRS